MKMKRVLLIVVALFMISTFNLKAQDYNTALGLRGGFGTGLTVKHFIDKNAAVEGIVAGRWRGLSITGLYEFHKSVYDIDNLKWFYGGGAHVGFWSGYIDHPWFDDTASHSVIGIDGIIGIEYTFDEVPLNIGIDWKPAINLIGTTNFWGDSGALSIRYVF